MITSELMAKVRRIELRAVTSEYCTHGEEHGLIAQHHAGRGKQLCVYAHWPAPESRRMGQRHYKLQCARGGQQRAGVQE